MKQLLFGLLCSGLLFGTALTTNAQTRPLSQDELMYQINTLLAQIASLQAIIDERERGITITGEPSITLTQPTPYMTIPDGISFTVAWEAENIPRIPCSSSIPKPPCSTAAPASVAGPTAKP